MTITALVVITVTTPEGGIGTETPLTVDITGADTYEEINERIIQQAERALPYILSERFRDAVLGGATLNKVYINAIYWNPE